MAIKNKEKPKAKSGSTALQEQGSLVAIYYAYKKGANLNNGNGNKTSKTAQLELDVALKKVYVHTIELLLNSTYQLHTTPEHFVKILCFCP